MIRRRPDTDDLVMIEKTLAPTVARIDLFDFYVIDR